jgi:GH25 family lysozyme M1 (1,4-beta-N-acetylmuramidase)
MLQGIDISHWQGKIDWKKLKTDFVFIKCSESTNYVDPNFEKNKEEIRKKGILLGFYHFARATDPKKEADFFVKSVGEIKEGELLVLDWEVLHSDPPKWCEKFLDRVTEKVGFRPLIYMNASTARSYDWSRVSKDYGLWLASYGKNDGKMHDGVDIGQTWPYWVVWQYTSRGSIDGISGNVDMNVAKDALPKYGKATSQITEESQQSVSSEKVKIINEGMTPVAAQIGGADKMPTPVVVTTEASHKSEEEIAQTWPAQEKDGNPSKIPETEEEWQKISSDEPSFWFVAVIIILSLLTVFIGNQ